MRGGEAIQAIRSSTYAGFDAITMTTSQLSVSVIPECGGKIVSLRSRRTQREWLWQDPHRPIRAPDPGGTFDRHDLSGWDECFPTIAKCPYPGPPGDRRTGISLDDHGELWSRPWQAVIEGDSVRMGRSGVALPYHFERTMTAAADGALELRYRVKNSGEVPLRYLWAAHPLLQAHDGMRIRLPPSAEMTKEFGYGGRIGADGLDGALGRFSRHGWPFVTGADGGIRDLSAIAFPDPPVTDKVVVRGLAAGWAELADATGTESLRMEFPAERIRFLGICANLGAWPFGHQPGRWLAIEPTNGGTDRLDEAVARREAGELAPHAVAAWHLRLSVHDQTVCR